MQHVGRRRHRHHRRPGTARPRRRGTARPGGVARLPLHRHPRPAPFPLDDAARATPSFRLASALLPEADSESGSESSALDSGSSRRPRNLRRRDQGTAAHFVRKVAAKVLLHRRRRRRRLGAVLHAQFLEPAVPGEDRRQPLRPPDRLEGGVAVREDRPARPRRQGVRRDVPLGGTGGDPRLVPPLPRVYCRPRLRRRGTAAVPEAPQPKRRALRPRD
mmetsp:Transcript_19123/g.64610  ORF Transcript_19123/g.64610 Transcript_19123/m.64610 type:complete len:218 (+) Transcript_19123:146-799(+)